MKNHYYIIFAFLLSGILNISCSNDYESVPLEKITIDFAFDKNDSIGSKASWFLNDIYSKLPEGYNSIDGNLLDAATDDAISIDEGVTTISKLATGAYSSINLISQDMKWADYYAIIRATSIFVNNIDVVPVKDTLTSGLNAKYAWKSEARFLRAYSYFELIKRYGGVPLMGDKVRKLGENVELPRSSFEDCVNYIVSECDAIKDSIWTSPIEDPFINSHRPTVGTVLALKARTLLYAASPLFNGGNIDPTNVLTGYTNTTPDLAYWKKAADAAKELIDLNAYALIDSFQNVFTTQNNKEIIFFRQRGNNHGIEDANGPIGFMNNAHGNGKTNPTQELVDAFPMNNGKAISDPSSGYNPAKPYINRDSRLRKTIIYNGCLWLSATIQTYIGGANNPIITSQSTTTTTTKTSYYMRKFMGNWEKSTQYGNVSHDWVSFRYAEVLLNYAEAENEYAGPTESVYQALKDLRKRSKILAGTDNMYGLNSGLTQDEMREIIRNERRIELAFEEHRYWDIRRWKIAEQVCNKPLHGLRIIKTSGIFSYTTTEVFTPIFTEKMYLYPIIYSEVVKNSNMKQNPGWDINK